VRKCLGVFVGLALLCALSWSQQAPAPAPASDSPQAPSAPPPANSDQAGSNQQTTTVQSTQTTTTVPTPKIAAKPYVPITELFAGYSFEQAGFFNAGHWAQLNGWDVSFAINLAPFVGIVVEGGQVFGESQISTGGAQAPFPNCPQFCPISSPTFNVDTREYNFLVGGQFPYRKHERWTPFGEVLVGHEGIRGIAEAQSPGGYTAEVSSGIALVAGAGADHKINDRYALRIKADYFQTRTDFGLIGKAKQDNLRVTVGIVIRAVKKKRRRLEDDTNLEQ
jgi:hypothetical protein